MQTWNPIRSRTIINSVTSVLFPELSLETEQELCLRWRDHHDISAAHRLAGSHLLLVVEVARAYRGLGLPQEEERPTTLEGLSRHFRVSPSTSGRSNCGL